jgi:hypothetical protein
MLKFTFQCDVTHDTNERTVAQFLVASNMRAVLHGIDIMPLGGTPATTPLKWWFGVQTTGGTANAGSFYKRPPDFDQTLQTTVRETFSSTDPTKSTPKYPLTLHQQGTMLQWVPAEPVVMEASERWGLWYDASQSALTVRYLFHLEE